MIDYLSRPIHMGLRRTVAPTLEPVSIAEAKDWLHITDDYEDLAITDLITAARQKVEDDTGTALLTQTWTYAVDQRPADHVFVLPVAPVQAVTSVTTYSEADTPTVISTSVYRVDLLSQPARVVLREHQSWPTGVRTRSAYEFVIVAGYASPSLIPAPLVHAVRLLLHHWHSTRAAVLVGAGMSQHEVPLAYESLIAPYKLRGGW
jgi:uncharacterized phiE125 gp8 family phage protein